MSIQTQLRRGTTAEHSTFTGAAGEVTVDTDKNVLVVHDGNTAGGNPQDNAGRIKQKDINIEDFTGKDGYILAYDETNDEFYLKPDEGGGGGLLSITVGNLTLLPTQLFNTGIDLPV